MEFIWLNKCILGRNVGYVVGCLDGVLVNESVGCKVGTPVCETEGILEGL